MKKNASNIIKVIFTGCFVFFLFFILMSAPEQVNHTLFISLIPCASASLIIIKKGPLKIERVFYIAASILTVLFLIMLSVFELIRSPLFSSFPFAAALYPPYLAASVFISLSFCLEYFCQSHSEQGNSPLTSDTGRRKNFTFSRSMNLLMIFYAAISVLFLMANFPFRPSHDAIGVYRSIIENNWSDWHPIGYVTFVRLCMLLASPIAFHPFAACAAQTILWILIIRLVSGILYQCSNSSTAVNCYIILNLVFFIPMMYLGIMYKDVIYSMCVLGLCGELYLILCRRQIEKKDVILLSLFSAGISLFRHMGIIVAIVPLLMLTGYFYFKKSRQWKKLLFCLFFTILSFVLVTEGYGARILRMEKNPDYVKYTVPLYLIGNLASGHPELFNEADKALLTEVMPLEDWAAAYQYNTYLADSLSREYGIIGDRINRVDEAYGMEILQLNLRLLLRSPHAWFSALSRVSSIVWQIGRPMDGYEWTAAGYYAPSDYPNFIHEGLVTTEKAICSILGDLQYSIENQPFLSFLYYRGGIWAFTLLFSAAVFLLKGRLEFLICLLPPALITAMLIISCPAQDPRFTLPVMETGMFFLPAVYYIRKRRDFTKAPEVHKGF